jgi:hypothetical protein
MITSREHKNQGDPFFVSKVTPFSVSFYGSLGRQKKTEKGVTLIFMLDDGASTYPIRSPSVLAEGVSSFR